MTGIFDDGFHSVDIFVRAMAGSIREEVSHLNRRESAERRLNKNLPDFVCAECRKHKDHCTCGSMPPYLIEDFRKRKRRSDDK